MAAFAKGMFMRAGCSILLAGLLTVGVSAQETRPAIQAAPRAKDAPTTANAAPQDTVPQAVSSDTYILGAGDVLQLSVWKEPGLSNASVPVRPDGQVSLPLVGDVPAAGSTPMALANEITARLKKYMNDPQVTVTVSGVRSKEIFLIGEIQKTGPIVLTPGMTPLQAIAAAGGGRAAGKSATHPHLEVLDPQLHASGSGDVEARLQLDDVEMVERDGMQHQA